MSETQTEGADMAAKGRYRSMDEVPAFELDSWLSEHCCRCGAVLSELERQWVADNERAAEEADFETLEAWQRRLGADGFDQVREEIAKGLLSAHPAYYSIRAQVPGQQQRDVQAGSYCICPSCLEVAFDDKPQHPVKPSHRWSRYLGAD
jgi:hypothetical protein